MRQSRTPRRVGEPKTIYRHRTRIGSFYIAPGRGGWEIQHGGETLGTRFSTPQAALEALVNGRTRLASGRTDPSTLGIDASLEYWETLGWVSGQSSVPSP